MSWCDRCGDVRTTCNAQQCDAHQCSRCRKALSADDIYLDENEQTHFKSCYACLHQMAAEDFEAEMLRWAERGRDHTDPEWALYCEAQIDSCAGELKKLMERG